VADAAGVQALLAARQGGPAAAAPALADEAEAYAWQDAVAQAAGWFSAGPARHWKSGGASRQGPQTHAALPPAGIWKHPADAAHWPFRMRGIEAEIALRLGQAVDAAMAAALDVGAARRLIDAMCVSIEVVDSRWAEGRDAPALAKLADLQSHGALVLGDWMPYEVRDWAAQRCTVQIGEEVPQLFTGTHAMADPAWVLPAWLRHATRQGAVLEAGTLVSTGTWCGLLMAGPGQQVVVRFEGIGEARLQL
jgi:2-keto-4-pentenoate hydratase/2-oxohepta-3-ene-1,7-dioic acid hydratase in catechol pathway